MKAFFALMPFLIIAANVYVVWRMIQILPTLWLKIAVPVLYSLTLVTYIGSFFGMLGHGSVLTAKINVALSPILVICLFCFLTFLVLDLCTLANLIPKDFARNNWYGSGAILLAISTLLTAGAINYRIKHRETLEITTEKHLDKPLKVFMASDLHLGYNISRKQLAKWIDMINREQPDLVLFAGDLIDNTTVPLFEDRFAEEFHRLTAPAYAVFGNHEFISGAEESARFYKEAGITLLQDSIINVHGLTLIGRSDRSAAHMATRPAAHPDASADPASALIAPRRPLAALTSGLDPAAFTILLDHQPYNLEEAEAAKIDFQFSGHTHRGQIWPITLLTDLMYEKSWGHHQRGSTRYYISSGLGIWGPKIRLGSRSEYLVVTISPAEF